MRYEIIHRTVYEYHADVLSSQHVARLTPRATARQTCLEHSLEILPKPQHQHALKDYYGNEAVFFSLEIPYRELTVTMRSVLELDLLQPELPFETPSWESVRDQIHQAPFGSEAGNALEFCFPSHLIPKHQAFADYAAPSFPPDRPLFEAALDLTRRIFEDFKFDPSATDVATPPLEVLKHRRGVCQDFAQVQIACLRSLGLAARYVSGYIETLPPPGQSKLVGADASHAWVSVYCPPLGWMDLDPTNNLRPSGQHVTLGWGRDFHDISPLRGVFISSGAQDLRVAVDVNRLD